MDILNILYKTLVILVLLSLLMVSIRALRDDFDLGKKYTKLFWIASFVIITISPFVVPIKINNYEEFRSIEFGIIYPFVEQHTLVNISQDKFPILGIIK